jgi:pimeloyl-ACP methyl ester carboxylesterase
VALPTGDDAGPIRDALGQQGFAVAYSSYSENGYDFKDGLQRTHQLRGLVTSRFGKPKRSFLLGQSLGSQIVQALAETHPDQYDGAVALCGVMGGTRRQINYIGHVRTMFDFMYPNWLPGTTTQDVPVIPSQGEVITAALTAMNRDQFAGFQRLAAIGQTQLAGNGSEKIQTLLSVLVYHARGVNDFIDRTHGHFLFNNANTQYVSPFLPAAYMVGLNETIARYTSTDDAEAWLENNYEPTGRLRIPMLTLHNQRDPIVPFGHEAAYEQKTSGAGSSANLVQRTREAYGHCNFGPALTLSTVQDLVQWVTTGTPATP